LIVNTQREKMNDLSQQVKETETTRIRDQEIKKEQAELSAKLDLLLSPDRVRQFLTSMLLQRGHSKA
jgi:hypothetical protein